MALYGFNVGVTGANTTSYYSVSLNQGTITDGGAATFTPDIAAYTYVSFQGNTVTFYAPQGDSSAGATVDASTTIAGNVYVSPPVNVPVSITVRGRGTILGSYSLPAGQAQGSFSFNVSSGESFGDAVEALQSVVQAPEKP